MHFLDFPKQLNSDAMQGRHRWREKQVLDTRLLSWPLNYTGALRGRMLIESSATTQINEKSCSKQAKVSPFGLHSKPCSDSFLLILHTSLASFNNSSSQTSQKSCLVLLFLIQRGTVCRHVHIWQNLNKGPKETWHWALVYDIDDQGTQAIIPGILVTTGRIWGE